MDHPGLTSETRRYITMYGGIVAVPLNQANAISCYCTNSEREIDPAASFSSATLKRDIIEP